MTTVTSGQELNVSDGQTSSGVVVADGGLLVVESGGTASATMLFGQEDVDGGATAVSTTIDSGGIEEVFGAASGTVIHGGGVQIVASGGTASGTVIEQGGTLDLQAGGVLAGSVAFAGGGTLQIDGTTVPTATISGFGTGDTIDLTGIAFDPAGSAVLTSGNVLQVSEDGETVTLNLDPSQSYVGRGFALASDGHGGTDLVDPPTLTTLVSFNGTNGANPFGGLIADAAGDLFGTTSDRGANGDGTVFEIAKTGGSYASTPTTLFSFNGSNGANPQGTLIADAAGDLFGMTDNGGASGDGTVFEIAKTGGSYASTPTTLVSFNGTNGLNPQAGLIADAAGDLFATTAAGGASGDGTVFELVNNGGGSYTFTPLVSFNGSDGEGPAAALIADAAGDLFGTTNGGGASGDGTVFEIAKTGGSYASTPTTLVSFNGTNGANPQAALIADAAGDLFGTTRSGGANGDGTVFELMNNGGGYALTTLVSFNGTDGAQPHAGLIADAAGDLFGVTEAGGASGDGTAFEIAKTGGGYAGTPTTLISFNGTDGEFPVVGLIADAAGDLFGPAFEGGASSSGTVGGTVFELSGTGFQTLAETAGGPYSGDENTAIALGGLSVSSTNAGDPLQTMLSVANGTITVGTAGGATVSNNGTASVSLSGTAAQIDTALGTASYQGGLDYYGLDTLSLTTTDTADGTQASATATIAVTGEVGSGSTATGLVVSSGVTLEVQSGGTASDTTVGGGGLFAVSAGGTASATSILSGGSETIGAGGSDVSATLSGGFQDVFGSAMGAVIAGNASQTIEAGGVASNTVISDGTEMVMAGGSDVGAILSGGSQDVFGTATGVLLDANASQTIESGGVANHTTVEADIMLIKRGGVAINTLINDVNAVEMVMAGGTDHNAKVVHGTQHVAGATSGTVIDAAVAIIERGGVAANTLLEDINAVEMVMAGGTDVSATLMAGKQVVYGTTSKVTLDANASQTVESGGVASDTTVDASDVEMVMAGGSDVGATLSGGYQDVSGTATGVLLDANASQTIEAGGVASNTMISSGTEMVMAGGSDVSATLSGGLQDVAGTATGAMIAGNASQTIEAAGVASNTVISDGTEMVMAGGSDVGATLSGGSQDVFGTATGVLLDANASQTIESGGVANHTTVEADIMLIKRGGVAINTLINDVNAVEMVMAGGSDVGAKVARGTQDVRGATSGTVILEAEAIIERGGVAANTLLDDINALEMVMAGGTDVSATLMAGKQVVYGTTSKVTLDANASQTVESGGVASDTTVDASDVEMVMAGGSDVGATLSGGYQDVSGTATGVLLDANASQTIESGGVASNTVISSGTEMVMAGGSDVGAILSGGNQDVFGTATGVLLDAHATQAVGRGGVTRNTRLDAGDTEVVMAGGIASDTTVDASDVEMVMAGGSDVGATLSGGYQDVSGTATGVLLDANASQTIESGGIASNTVINSGTEMVMVGGSDVGATLSGGEQDVFGTATGVLLDAHARQIVHGGGVAVSTTVGNTDAQIVLSGDTASLTTVLSGGNETISAGGFDIGATLSGGEQDVFGTATGVVLDANGSQTVESGGVASNTTISSGTEDVASGGAAVNVTFTGTSGLLDLAQPQVLSGTITGWQVGDVIDFASTSLTSAGISASMLSVTASGGRNFSYQLADQQANTFATLQSDGNGGTDVTLAAGGPDLGLLLGAGPAGADNVTNSNNPMFVGLALPGSTVVLYDGTTKIGNGQANAQGVWTITANTLPLGTNMITAAATDTHGHTTTSLASDMMTSGTSFQTSSNGTGNGTGNENANFQGGSQSNTFTFGSGTVVVTAANGSNAVTGGGGWDTVHLGDGPDTVSLGNGNDTVTLGNGHNMVTLGNGTDSLTVGSGPNTINLGSGSYSVTAGGGNDSVSLTGNGGSAVLSGGNYSVSLSGKSDTLTLGNGNDSLTVSGTGSESVTAGTGNDTFTLGSSTTSLVMQGMHDTVSVIGGTDTLTDTPGGVDQLMLQVGGTVGGAVVGGAVTVANFSPAHGVLLLAQALATAEGWSTPGAIAAHLGADGNGGSLLGLTTPSGTNLGSIDFQGVAKTQLTANNFQIH